MSPSGLVSIRAVKPVPAPVVAVATILPATKTSEALVVVTAPEELDALLPFAPFAISKGLDVSRPLYSRTRMSGYEVEPPNVTVTVFDPPAMFLA